MRLSFLTLLVALVACGDDVSDDAGPRNDVTERDVASDGASDVAAVNDASAEVDANANADAPGRFDAGPPSNPLATAGEVEAVVGDFNGETFGFMEGPHWLSGELFFTDQYFGRPDLTAVYALTPPNTVRVVVQPSDGANGLAHTPSGQLIACHQAGRRVGRISDDTIETVYERYEDAAYNAPNDLIFRHDGGWFFTDPGYGSEGDAEMDVRGVYFVPAGELSANEPRRVWSGTLEQRPNGVVLSPDDGILYLTDTADGVVRAFDVAPNGDLAAERIFANVEGPDGMTVDVTGNVYVSTRMGIEVFAPDGTRWGGLELEGTTNAAFGDDDRRTLYITTRNTLFQTRLDVQGIEGR